MLPKGAPRRGGYFVNHHTARVIAGRTNGIGRRLGCSCCNAPRRLVPTFGRTVRTRIERAGSREIERWEDDVPTPEEIDPSLLNCFDCDHDCERDHPSYLDVFGAARAL